MLISLGCLAGASSKPDDLFAFDLKSFVYLPLQSNSFVARRILKLAKRFCLRGLTSHTTSAHTVPSFNKGERNTQQLELNGRRGEHVKSICRGIDMELMTDISGKWFMRHLMCPLRIDGAASVKCSVSLSEGAKTQTKKLDNSLKKGSP